MQKKWSEPGAMTKHLFESQRHGESAKAKIAFSKL